MRKLIAAILIATTVFFHACTGKDALSDDESEPPDALPAELPVPSLDKAEDVGARQAVKDVIDAEEQLIQDEAAKYRAIYEHRAAVEKAREVRVAREQAEAEEAERQRKIALEAERAKAVAEKGAETKTPGRSISEQVGAGQAYTATAFTAYCEGCSGITYTGIDLRKSIYHEGKRVIATDPGHIPLGSIVRVTLTDGTTFDAIAEDIGGLIKGAIIDVAHETNQEAYAFGRQSVVVEIIREGRG